MLELIKANIFETISIFLSLISIILTYKIYTFTLRFERKKAENQSEKILYILNENTQDLKDNLNTIFMSCVPATIIKQLTKEGAEMVDVKSLLGTLNNNEKAIKQNIKEYQNEIKEIKYTFASDIDVNDFNKINKLERTTKKFLKDIDDYQVYFTIFDTSHNLKNTRQNTSIESLKMTQLIGQNKAEREKKINNIKFDIVYNSLTKILRDIKK